MRIAHSHILQCFLNETKLIGLNIFLYAAAQTLVLSIFSSNYGYPKLRRDALCSRVYR